MLHNILQSFISAALGSGGVTDAVSIAETISQGGAVLILILVVMAIGYAYREERKKNEKLHAQILENSKEMLTALNGVTNAVSGFKDMLLAMRLGYSSQPPPSTPVNQQPGGR